MSTGFNDERAERRTWLERDESEWVFEQTPGFRRCVTITAPCGESFQMERRDLKLLCKDLLRGFL